MTYTSFRHKVRITGRLRFDTAFHIGSGKEGDLATDMGVLKDRQNRPVMPGSTLKGNFRATAERLAAYFGLSACLLDKSLSDVKCVSDQVYFISVKDTFKKITREKDKLTWLENNTCHVCQLFGSPLQSSRIYFSDGRLTEWEGGFQVRDGVAIDRDSGTARNGMKYDFEVTSKDTAFELIIDLENPNQNELALVSAAISEWQNGFKLGGFTSRGLGSVVLEHVEVKQVDYRNPEQLKAYLLKRTMEPAVHLLSEALQRCLNEKEASHA